MTFDAVTVGVVAVRAVDRRLGEALAGEAGHADAVAGVDEVAVLPVKTKMPSEVAVLPSPVGSWM